MNQSLKKFALISAMFLAGFGFASQAVMAEETEPIEITEEAITEDSEEIIEEVLPEEFIEVVEDEEVVPGTANPSDTDLNIQAHVANVGWMPEVHEEDIVGTTGQAHALEAVIINLESVYAGDIHYQTHVSNIGWMDPVEGGQIGGTEGRALSVEAIRIWLTGEVSDKYDIYYQTHVANIGWLGWTKNGKSAGSQGQGYAMEALQIQLVEKGKEAPVSMLAPFYVQQLEMEAHVANVGWMDPVSESSIAGTVGQGNAIEGLKIRLANPVYSGDIEYRVYVEQDGWQSKKVNNALSGTEGKAKHIEAIEISLTGEMAEHYDIFYQAHVANLGWLGWAKNGEKAGSIGYDYGIEAIHIMIHDKDVLPPTSSKEPFDSALLSYNTHVSYVGWTAPVSNSQPSGNLYNSIEAISLSINKDLYSNSDIQYRSHIENIGWEPDWKKDGEISGTYGQSLALEAIQVKLSGDIAKDYNVYYRTYTLGYGWLDWASNGHSAGTEGLARSILGIQVSLVPVSKAPSVTGSEVSFVTNKGAERDGESVTGRVRVNDGQSTIFIYDGPTGISMYGIDISAHNGAIDLNAYKDQFVIIRVSYGTYLDVYAKRNMDLCEKLGIPYGVYCYSYALDNDQALSEANFLLEQIKGRDIKVGVWFDMEDADGYKQARGALTPYNCSSFCRTFCSRVREAGYFTGIYSSSSWFGYYIRGCDEYDKWVANWGINDGNLGYRTDYLGPIQQFTSIPLDRNVMYVPLEYFQP